MHRLHGADIYSTAALQAGIHMFVEKPLSAKPPEEVVELSQRLERLQADKGIIVAVGYMLRYSPAVEVTGTAGCVMPWTAGVLIVCLRL